MVVETYVDRARERVTAEREAVDAKHEAFGAFADRVAELPTEQSPARGVTATVTATGARFRADVSTDDGCRAVRRAFAETVRPHSVADEDGGEPLLATVRKEFTDAIAVALAPTTGTTFSAGLERSLVAEVDARRAEIATTSRALDRERSQLADAAAAVDGITAWIADADETPLTDLGFEALSRRHRTLATHRERCEELAHERQTFLRGTTSRSAEARVGHRSLVGYLYRDFPVEHPVLATAARLDAVCAECQRAVRDHLVRRA
ncbi:hypothetical protein ACFQE8_11405 [Salinirubellus sp. GCM10025818]|uniref:DUF7260 family protein n=1 Tax=Salinirubellus TaxID=2162630 RepID=UPI0030CA7B76